MRLFWTLLVPVLWSSALAIAITSSVVALDTPLARFFVSVRTPFLVNVFLAISVLGKVVTVLSIAALFSLYALWKKRGKALLPFFITLAGTEGVVSFLKIAVGRERPASGIAYYLEHSLSFPSAHAAIALALYGFLAYFFIRKEPNRHRRRLIALAALLLIFLIGLSRLYLGVHYLTDVLGGYLVGGLFLFIGIALMERKN